MEDLGLVSVIMPCHNGAKYINESVKSVLNQTYKNFELIIVLDHCTDESEYICENLKKNDERIIVLKNLRSTGNPATPRNMGIEKARGRYISFLDCDDVWLEEKLAKQIGAFDGTVSIVYSYYEKIDSFSVRNGRVIKAPLNTTYDKMLLSDVIGNLTGVYDTIVVGKVFQKEVHQEDYIMWLEILKKFDNAVCIPEVLALYRISNDSLSHSKIKHFTWQWNTYRKELNISFFKALFLYVSYVVHGIVKYLK